MFYFLYFCYACKIIKFEKYQIIFILEMEKMKSLNNISCNIKRIMHKILFYKFIGKERNVNITLVISYTYRPRKILCNCAIIQ